MHWTFTVHQRAAGWLTSAFHAKWREILLHTCARYELHCPTYVLMPDHVHLLLMGIDEQGSDQRTAIAFLRKHTRPALAPHRWQQQAHDHVLRGEERTTGRFRKTAHYVAENPVRADLVEKPADWPFAGCCIPGYPEFEIHAADYWMRFWRYHRHVTLSREAER